MENNVWGQSNGGAHIWIHQMKIMWLQHIIRMQAEILHFGGSPLKGLTVPRGEEYDCAITR